MDIAGWNLQYSHEHMNEKKNADANVAECHLFILINHEQNNSR